MVRRLWHSHTNPSIICCSCFLGAGRWGCVAERPGAAQGGHSHVPSGVILGEEGSAAALNGSFLSSPACCESLCGVCVLKSQEVLYPCIPVLSRPGVTNPISENISRHNGSRTSEEMPEGLRWLRQLPHSPIQVSLSLTLTDELDSGPAPASRPSHPRILLSYPRVNSWVLHHAWVHLTLLHMPSHSVPFCSPPRMSDSLSRLSSAPQAEFLKINACFLAFLAPPVLGKDFLS